MAELGTNNCLQGIVCASVTPFSKEREIDEVSLARLMEYLSNSGVDALFPLGTNGEGLLLSLKERIRVGEVILQAVNGKIPVILHCGATTYRETLALLHHAKAAGASACSIITPSFYPLSQQALFEYFDCLLTEASGFPIYAYNIPSRTGNDLLPATLQKLAEKHRNLVGIKYSAQDLTRLCQYMAVPKTDVLLGCDRLIYPAMKMGAVGAISGPCALMPDLFCMLRDAINQGKDSMAQKLQTGLQKVSETLKKYQELPMLKAGLVAMGILKEDYCIAAFHSMSESEKQAMVTDVQTTIQAIRKELAQ